MAYVNGDIVQGALKWTGPSPAAFCVRYWNVAAVVGTITPADVALNLRLHLSAAAAAVVPGACQFCGIRVQGVLPTVDQSEAISTNVISGTYPDQGVQPPQVAGLLRFHSLNAGTTERAFSFVPFVPESAVASGGGWEVQYNTALSVLASRLVQPFGMFGAMGACQLVPGLYKRDLQTILTALVAVVRPFPATQRRRSPQWRPWRLDSW